MKVKNSTMQAFPFIEPHEDDNIKTYHPGMTMRDEFAKAAMQVLMAERDGDGDDNPGAPRWESHEVAELAYDQADAMMKARK
jgi:hypothetical protein